MRGALGQGNHRGKAQGWAAQGGLKEAWGPPGMKSRAAEGGGRGLTRRREGSGLKGEGTGRHAGTGAGEGQGPSGCAWAWPGDGGEGRLAEGAMSQVDREGLEGSEGSPAPGIGTRTQPPSVSSPSRVGLGTRVR